MSEKEEQTCAISQMACLKLLTVPRFICTLRVAYWRLGKQLPGKVCADACAPMALFGVLEHVMELLLAGPPYNAVDNSRGGAPYPHAALPHAHNDARVLAHLSPL